MMKKKRLIVCGYKLKSLPQASFSFSNMCKYDSYCYKKHCIITHHFCVNTGNSTVNLPAQSKLQFSLEPFHKCFISAWSQQQITCKHGVCCRGSAGG